MSRLGKTKVRLQALRRKFVALVEAARARVPRFPGARARRATRLREMRAFGQNPGNLRMLAYVPKRLPRLAPLVVVLHGGGQSADEYDQGTGWSSLADRLGFAVVYPEQQPANNPMKCFSWFLPDHVGRGGGEARSIRQMVEHAVAAFGVDPGSVFVTGFSAGGAMAAVMLAAYPEVFAGGAIIAGLPYGCARSEQEAFEAMFTERSSAAPALGDRVRQVSGHSGPWPKISIWHGTADPIVKPCNGEDTIRQWADLHGVAADPSYEETIGNHSRRVWQDADGNTLIEAIALNEMAHGVPLGSAMGKDNCGSVGTFFLDAGISSTQHIANFWWPREARLGMPRVQAAHANARVA
jgi:poly(hydroxyalkanoate) depolymerase family esterase